MRTRLVLFSLALSLSVLQPSCTKKEQPKEATQASTSIAAPAAKTMPTWDQSKRTKGPQGLQWEILTPGKGDKPKTGQTVTVHYAGWLLDGRLFDASVDRKQPFSFVLGRGQVIRGWDLAVADMLPGEIRRVRIPPHIAYGTRGTGAGIIPPNATLVFDIHLISAK